MKWAESKLLRWILIFGLLLLIPYCTHADVLCKDWTTADTYREVTYHAVQAADWKQTLDIKNHPGYHETNVFLGDHPSDARINNYMLGLHASHFIIACILEQEHRKLFQYGSIAYELITVIHNQQIGIEIHF